jgi:ectoine hydroxylase-related dioxygenase (phytanoyl-CoA dioxygenase family)
MEAPHREKYQLTLNQRRFFGTQGYLKVEGLLSDAELCELDRHSMNMALGKVDLSQLEGLTPRNEGTTPAEMEDKFFRFIQFHRHLEIHERFTLHRRILDVLEILIGPDVMAMQSMLFLKPPQKTGQAYHQDSFYIKTAPDTLCGTWIAIDDCDDQNGCMYFIPGSNFDPIYQEVAQPENTEDFQERLTEIAGVDDRREVPAIAKAGDVIFFHGHLIHRSKRNRSTDRFRRAYVCHYANARSYTEWGSGNQNHILARGTTHLPFANPLFVVHDPLG